MRAKNKTKIEKFIEQLLMAGPWGIDPKILTSALDSLNVPRFAGVIRKEGISVSTEGNYGFVSKVDALMALDSLNRRRARRGEAQYGEDFLNEWI